MPSVRHVLTIGQMVFTTSTQTLYRTMITICQDALGERHGSLTVVENGRHLEGDSCWMAHIIL
jgi:hypothetical protein